MDLTKYLVLATGELKQDVIRAKKQGYDINLLFNVVKLLANGEPLPGEYKDHPLFGRRAGHRECYIKSDWLLMYKVSDDTLVLVSARMEDVQ